MRNCEERVITYSDTVTERTQKNTGRTISRTPRGLNDPYMVALTEALSNPSRPVRRLLDMALTWENAPIGEVPPPPAYRTFRQLRPHEVDELVALFDPGADMGVKELAAKFGVHRSTIGKFLKERGTETRPTLKPEDIPAAAALYRSGLTLAQVAQRYGVAKDTVRLKLIEAGIEMRSSWESRRR